MVEKRLRSYRALGYSEGSAGRLDIRSDTWSGEMAVKLLEYIGFISLLSELCTLLDSRDPILYAILVCDL
jgi:hypothetical protein